MMTDDREEFCNTIASRLANDSFSVQRDVRTNLYTLNVLASRVRPGYTHGAAIPSSKVISAISVDSPSISGVSAYSSFVEKYALENRRSLAIGRKDLTTLPVMVSSGISDELKRWISETSPPYSIMWDRTIFPVLVDMSSRSVIYDEGTPFRHMTFYPELRTACKKWFNFQNLPG